MKKIVVMGIGYVGLPLALMLAKSGSKVIGVDINEEVVKALNEREFTTLSIKEPDIHKLLESDEVKLNFKSSFDVCDADIFIISVPTPLHEHKKESDLIYVKSALGSIIPHLKKGNLVIIESTIPPLTTRNVIKPIIENKTDFIVGEDIFLAHCPERILPGNVYHEIIHNSRVIGGINEKSCQMTMEIYKSFVKAPIYITDDVTAELVKLIENTYRDVNIALANELSLIAESLNVDIKKAINIANEHPRVNVLTPGIGVGGHCIPIDPWFLSEIDPEKAVLIVTARRINDQMPFVTARKIRKALKDIPIPKIVVLGITYKPNIPDIRESPALKICDILEEEGYDITIYDPLIERYHYNSIIDIVKNIDCLIILVEHDIIKTELEDSLDKIKSVMNHPMILKF